MSPSDRPPPVAPPPATTDARWRSTRAPAGPPVPLPACPVTGAWSGGEFGRGAIFNDLSSLDDQHTAERHGFAHIMVMHSKVAPRHHCELAPAVLGGAHGQAHGKAHRESQGVPWAATATPQPYPLPFPARHRGRLPRQAVFAAHREAFPAGREGRQFRLPGPIVREKSARTIAKILEEGTVPELDARIDPGGGATQAFEAPAVKEPPSIRTRPVAWPMPAKEEPGEARLASARRTTMATWARLDVKVDLFQDRMSGSPHATPRSGRSRHPMEREFKGGNAAWRE